MKLLGVLVLVALSAAAQSSQFIHLEIGATDSSGHPVTDLRPDEFRIVDEETPQSIAFFRRNGDSAPWQSAPLAPGEFSNRSAARPVTTVVIDLADSPTLEVWWDTTVRAVQRFASSTDLYFYMLSAPNGTLVPLRPLPDSEVKAGAPPAPFSTASLPAFSTLAGHQPLPFKESGAFDTWSASRYATLESLASQMALLPGHKSLVWIGVAPPIIGRYHNAQLPPGQAEGAESALHLLSLLDQANIAVYTVETTKFYQPGGMGDTHTMSRGAEYPMLGSNAGIAGLTGGQTYQDEIEKALAQAVSATHDGYRVLYRAPLESRTPYRKIKVTSTRRGVRLSTKQAYFYETAAGAAETVARELTGSTAAALRDAPDIGLRVAIARTPEKPRVLHVTTRIDAADLLLIPDSGTFRGNLSLQFIGETEDGRATTLAEPMRVGLRLAPADREAAMKNGLSFPDDLLLDATIRRLRVIVTDERAAAAGSVTIPLESAKASPIPTAPATDVPPATAALNHVSEFVRTAIAQLPRYTCSATVNRTYLRQTREVGRSCDDIIAARRLGRANLKPTATDRLRFDVEVADGGYEIFSWPGASRIDSEKIEHFSDGGPIGTGPFGPFLIDIFDNPETSFDSLGEETIEERKLLAWRFRVPASASHYKVGITPSIANAAPVLHIVPYEGRFWIDPSTRQLARLEVRTTALPPETQSCEGDTVVDLQSLKIGEGEYLIPRQSVMRITGKYGEDSESTTVYSACHEFRGETTVRFDDSGSDSAAAGVSRAALISEPLPAGLPIMLTFETQIDTDKAAAGDRVNATVARDVFDPASKQRLLAAGARISGRILHLEHHFEGRDYFIVSIAFDSPHLVLDHGRGILSPKEASACWGSVDRIESKGRLSEGSTFILPSRDGRYVTPRGCQSSWITVP